MFNVLTKMQKKHLSSPWFYWLCRFFFITVHIHQGSRPLSIRPRKEKRKKRIFSSPWFYWLSIEKKYYCPYTCSETINFLRFLQSLHRNYTFQTLILQWLNKGSNYYCSYTHFQTLDFINFIKLRPLSNPWFY